MLVFGTWRSTCLPCLCLELNVSCITLCSERIRLYHINESVFLFLTQFVLKLVGVISLPCIYLPVLCLPFSRWLSALFYEEVVQVLVLQVQYMVFLLLLHTHIQSTSPWNKTK